MDLIKKFKNLIPFKIDSKTDNFQGFNKAMAIYNDVLKIIWITRSFSTLVEKELVINRELPRIYFYGRVFEFINLIFGLNSISKKKLFEKGFFCSLEYDQGENIINTLIDLNFAQESTNRDSIELLFPDNKFTIYNKLLEEKSFGELKITEINCLKLLDILSNKLKSFEEILDAFPNIEEAHLKHIIILLNDLKIIDVIKLEDSQYYITPLKTYGDYEKYVKFCQKHSSEEIDLVGELLEFCNKHKGIPIGLLPENLKEIGKICLDNGILHGVNYEFGTFVGDSSFTLVFPTKEEFDMLKGSFNDFEKIHATIGLLVYGVYYNPHPIRSPERYIDALISREKLRGTSIHIDEKYKQFNPCIFSGIIDFSPGFSKYFNKYGELRTYRGVIPQLIPSEENREALKLGARLFQENEEFNLPLAKKIQNSIIDMKIGYADTAGISTHKFKKKKSLKNLKIEEIYDIIRRT